MSTKTPLCSQCANAGVKQPADFKVVGTMNRRPYRANLCLEHNDMLLLDGASFRIHKVMESANAGAVALYAEQLWKNYEGFKEMCGALSEVADRAHRKYIEVANRARDMGLNY